MSNTLTARHAAQPSGRFAVRKPRKVGRRRVRRITLIVGVLLAIAIVAVAAALLRAPLLGNLIVPAVDPDMKFVTLPAGDATTGQPVRFVTNTADCTATLSGSGNLTINATGASGTGCTVVTAVSTNGSGGNYVPKIQTVSWASEAATVGFTTATYVGAGSQTVNVANGCGKNVPNEGGSLLRVAFKITVKPDMEPGTYAAGTDAGVSAVHPDDYVAGSCPTV